MVSVLFGDLSRRCVRRSTRQASPSIRQAALTVVSALAAKLLAELVKVDYRIITFSAFMLRVTAVKVGVATRPRASTKTPSAKTTPRLCPVEPWAQDVLAQAAVIGRRFTTELLEATLGLPRERILLALQHARQRQLIVEEPSGFSFRHALTREAIYDNFLAAQLREFHRRIAQALEAAPGEGSVADLAYHWFSAKDHQKAARYCEAAANEAKRVFANEEAVRYFEYALQSVEPRSAQAGRIGTELGWAYSRQGMFSLSVGAHEGAQAVFRHLGDLAAECAACIERVGALYRLQAANRTGPLDELRSRIEAAGDRALLARCDLSLAQVYALRSQTDEAAAILERLEPQHLDPALLTVYHATRATLAGRVADVERLGASVQAAVRAAEAPELVSRRAIVLSNAASALSDLGRFDEADRYFAETEALARACTFKPTLMFTLATRSHQAPLRGTVDAARDDVVAALSIGIEYEVAQSFVATVGTTVGTLLDDESLVDRCFDEDLARAHVVRIAAAFADRWYRLGRAGDARESSRGR
jgi:tetratricopeptide (TPR) repeat protein